MSFIRLATEGSTAILSFSRPPANAFNLGLVEEFAAKLAEIAARPPTGGLVVTGEGRVFSGGVDFKEVPRYDADERRRMIDAINSTITSLYGMPTATVAAVNGHAIGGAFVVMLACDARLAAQTDAKLGLTEVTAGIPYPACPMEVVKAELGARDRRKLVLTGEIITPADAHARGILDELVPAAQLLSRAIDIAHAHARFPSYARVKDQLRRDTVDRMGAIIAAASDPMREHWI